MPHDAVLSNAKRHKVPNGVHNGTVVLLSVSLNHRVLADPINIVIIVRTACFEMIKNSILAIGTSVSSVKPLLNTGGVEPVQARKDHVLLLKLEGAHAYRAGLIFLGEILPIAISEVCDRKVVNYPLRNRLNYILIKV